MRKAEEKTVATSCLNQFISNPSSSKYHHLASNPVQYEKISNSGLTHSHLPLFVISA